MTYRVVMTDVASKELDRAVEYVRQRGAPMAARRWSSQLRAHIKTLARHPERCPLAPESELFDQPFRELLFGAGNRGTYRIIFMIKEEFVVVIHVRHGSMLPFGAEED